VVVCPGGGYSGRATGHEGDQILVWLNDRGITAFILKYRTVGESKIDPPLEPGPMLDVQRAIRTVRAKAKDYGVDPKRIGVWGFSAGGHLASTATTHFDAGKEDGDEIDKTSCRPDFAILAYPVITMTEKTHGGSRNNLIGKNPDPKLVEFYSNEKHVTKDTPPVFLFHTVEDKVVPIENSRMFKAGVRKSRRPRSSWWSTRKARTVSVWRRKTRSCRSGRPSSKPGSRRGGCWRRSNNHKTVRLAATRRLCGAQRGSRRGTRAALRKASASRLTKTRRVSARLLRQPFPVDRPRAARFLLQAESRPAP